MLTTTKKTTLSYWKEGLQKAREKAKEWHASKEGLEWHIKQGKYTWINRKRSEKICVQCKKVYSTFWPRKSMYCSKKCGSRFWNKNNSEKIVEYNKTRKLKYKNDPLEYKKRAIEYYRKNSKEVGKKQQKYCTERMKTDVKFKLKKGISSLINLRLRARLSSKNYKSTFSFLPYTVDELIIHIEKQFEPWMSWNNHDKWHIDHIKPDCSFNYKSVEDKEFQDCWALNNLRPLEAKENIKKGGKLIY